MLFEVAFGRVNPWEPCHGCTGNGTVQLPATGQRVQCPQCQGTRYHRWRSYAYWHGEHVYLGDIVQVPPNTFRREPAEATVVKIGSDYQGVATPIDGIIERPYPPF